MHVVATKSVNLNIFETMMNKMFVSLVVFYVSWIYLICLLQYLIFRNKWNKILNVEISSIEFDIVRCSLFPWVSLNRNILEKKHIVLEFWKNHRHFLNIFQFLSFIKSLFLEMTTYWQLTSKIINIQKSTTICFM